ncbi:hypothetical protein [Pontiella desulfatans]|uniref:hypothetical protein n=1 Tax=Pontiella desulfatans TaxID=2750659 RepID=UPI00109D0895|nr:hypothetical protein [Pontiella desulfatans]
MVGLLDTAESHKKNRYHEPKSDPVLIRNHPAIQSPINPFTIRKIAALDDNGIFVIDFYLLI